MDFQGKDHICSTVCIYNNVTEQINSFKYLSYYVIYENGKVLLKKFWIKTEQLE
jgi:hypothetical protein